MRGVPECPDCGTEMQQLASGWRCPFATRSQQVAHPTGTGCGRGFRRETAGMSGHFLGSSDMRQARA